MTEKTAIPVTLAESFVWRSGIDEIRACLFCHHSNREVLPPARRCYDARVSGKKGVSIDCHAARAATGMCGPEARYLWLTVE